MHEYRLTPAFFVQARNRLLTFGIPLLLAVLGAIWLMEREAFSSQGLVTAAVLAACLAFAIWNAWRALRRTWSSYRLLVDAESIRRVRQGLADLVIVKSEISRIVESGRGGLLVEASSPSRRISIPATVEAYANVRDELAQWHPIEAVPAKRAARLSFIPIACGVLALAALVVTFTASNPHVVIAVGTLLFLTMIGSTVAIQRNAEMTRRDKRGSWLIVFPLIAVGLRVILAIIGN